MSDIETVVQAIREFVDGYEVPDGPVDEVAEEMERDEARAILAALDLNTIRANAWDQGRLAAKWDTSNPYRVAEQVQRDMGKGEA